MKGKGKIYVGHHKAGGAHMFNDISPDGKVAHARYKFVTGPFKSKKEARSYMNQMYGRG